ncbi:unnamed protein product [Phytophthora fragariaefolia]|uniref:Unnamed protein product n=1 Tax=Phytophthora fragariaefolia TaxID=1490495 RepID=A0A9W6YNE1_9STRA|nr:unnamed protein product [Phytophthora fragariaefolia]
MVIDTRGPDAASSAAPAERRRCDFMPALTCLDPNCDLGTASKLANTIASKLANTTASKLANTTAAIWRVDVPSTSSETNNVEHAAARPRQR